MGELNILQVHYQTEVQDPERSRLLTEACGRARQQAMAHGGNLCYSFKVLGESKLLLVTEGNVQDNVLDALQTMGLHICNTECIPVYPYKTFAQNVLQLEASLIEALSAELDSGGMTMWVQVEFSFTGPDISLLWQLWQEEIEMAAEMNITGIKFKAVARNMVLGAFSSSYADFDKGLAQLPLFTKRREFSQATTRVWPIKAI